MKMQKLASILPFLLVFSVGCQTRAVPEAPPPPPIETEAVFSQAELDQLLAPIALYPDALLSQVLMASTYPLEVVEASRWSQDLKLEGEAAVDAAQTMDWDISIKALVAFPDLIQLMDEQLSWTRKLGDAFLLQEEQVMETIQMLRRKSLDAGNLDSMEHLVVRQQDEVIIVEPREVEIIYVPYYNTRYVYGDWWWYDYPPFYWDYPRYHYNHLGFYWGTGFRISSRFYFSFCDWHHHDIILHQHRWYHGRDRKPERHDLRDDYHELRDFDRPGSSGRIVRRDEVVQLAGKGEPEDIKVWNHNPYHRRGIDYKSDSLNRTLERSSASGISKSTLPSRTSRTAVRPPELSGNRSDTVSGNNTQKSIPSTSRSNRIPPESARSVQQDRSTGSETRSYTSPSTSSRNRTTPSENRSSVARSTSPSTPPTTATRSSRSSVRPPAVSPRPSTPVTRTSPSTSRSSSSRSATRPPAASPPPSGQMAPGSSSTGRSPSMSSSRSSTARSSPSSSSRSSSGNSSPSSSRSMSQSSNQGSSNSSSSNSTNNER